MPRRKKSAPTATVTSAEVHHVDTSLQEPAKKQRASKAIPTIDYDQLAAAMLRQQQAQEPQEAAAMLRQQQAQEPQETAPQPHQTGPVPTSAATTSPSVTASTDVPTLPLQLASHEPSFSILLDRLFSGSKDNSTLAGPPDHSSARDLNVHLSNTTQNLLRASLAESSRRAYRRSWKLLLDFCHINNLKFTFPSSEIIICNFIGNLFEQHLKPSTIVSHVSALSYVHKVFDKPDPTHSFFIKKLLQGVQKSGSSADTRLPITKTILVNIITALSHTVSIYTDRILLKAIFLLAFHGFMRLGELIARTAELVPKVVQRQDSKLLDPSSLHLTL